MHLPISICFIREAFSRNGFCSHTEVAICVSAPMNKLLAFSVLLLSFARPAYAAWDLSEPSSPLLIAIGLAGIAAIVHYRNRK